MLRVARGVIRHLARRPRAPSLSEPQAKSSVLESKQSCPNLLPPAALTHCSFSEMSSEFQ